MRLKIEKLVYGGVGLARTDLGVVFVAKVAPGDLIEAEIIETKKDYSIARLSELLEPSPDRQSPVCTSGCCSWQHIRYDKQVEYKEAIIRESLQRLGRLEWTKPIERITGPDKHYRLRATFHVADDRIGFMQEKTHVVVPIRECASLVPELNRFVGSVDPDGARSIHAISTPDVAYSLVFTDGTIRRSGLATVHVDGIQYRLRPETFFQANRFLLAPFIDEVRTQVGPSPRNVLELYSGVGFFSIPLAQNTTELIGVERDRVAVRQAQENARLNNAWNLRIFEGQIDATLRGAKAKPEVVVMDPPRAGCGARNVERIVGLTPERIVYVSCNPTTFAREAAIFASKGYQLQRLTMVDQFPNTYHIEMVALFSESAP